MQAINVFDLNNYFKTFDNSQMTFDIYNTSADGNISVFYNSSLVSFNSTKNWNGQDWLIFRATTSAGFNVSNKIFLNVLPVNDAPILQSINDTYAVEGALITIIANASDVDSSFLTYTINDSRFNKNNNTFTWQTSYNDSGIYYALVGVSDGNLSDSKTVKVIVLPKIVINELVPVPSSGNDWVEIYNPRDSINMSGCYLEDLANNTLSIFGTLQNKSFFVADWSNRLNNDGDTIKLICSGKIVDIVTYGSIPIGKSYGRVSDGLDNWTIFSYPTKEFSNSADMESPVVSLIAPANNTLFKIGDIIFNYTVSDNNAGILNCSFYSDMNGTFKELVKNATADDSVGFFWASKVDDGAYLWQVKCSDGRNIGESEIRNFSVDEPDAPVVQNINNITVNETEIVFISVSASDPDKDDVLRYDINDSRFSKNENNFTWVTGYDDAGTYEFNVGVSDGLFNVTKNVFISVLGKNRAPIIEAIDNKTINEDENGEIIINASDPDKDGLIYNITKKNASEVNCLLNGTKIELMPYLNWNGLASCEIEASDNKLSDKKTFNITVLPINDAPVLKSLPNLTFSEGGNAIILANASDVDSSFLTYTINDSRFNKNNNTFTWQTSYNDSGIYNVLVNVSDGLLNDSQQVKITITDNSAPEIISHSPNTNFTLIAEDGTQTFSISWTDGDNPEDVAISWYRDGIKDGNSSIYNFVGNGDSKYYNISVIVSDGEYQDSYEWTLRTSNISITEKYNGNTTNFTAITNLSSANLILELLPFGKIEFLDKVDLTSVVDLDKYSDIGPASAGIDTSVFSTLKNKKARITFNNLIYNKTPTIYHNSGFTFVSSGTICPDSICSNITYNNSILGFDVTGFSTFIVGDTRTCSQLSGYVCGKNEICKGNLITAFDTNSCCSISCVPNLKSLNVCENHNSNLQVEIEKPDAGDEFKPGETVKGRISITNNFDAKIDSKTEISLYYPADDDKIDSFEDVIRIKSGDGKDVDFELDIPDNTNEGSYYLYAKVIDDDNNTICNDNYIKLNMARESNDILIDSFIIQEQAVCGDSINAAVSLKNNGNDDSEVYIVLENKELGIYEQTDKFDLEKYGSNDETIKDFILEIPGDAEDGEYNFEAIAYFENKKVSIDKKVLLDKCERLEIAKKIEEKKAIKKLIASPVRAGSEKSNFYILIDILLAIGIIMAIILIVSLKRKDRRKQLKRDLDLIRADVEI